MGVLCEQCWHWYRNRRGSFGMGDHCSATHRSEPCCGAWEPHATSPGRDQYRVISDAAGQRGLAGLSAAAPLRHIDSVHTWPQLTQRVQSGERFIGRTRVSPLRHSGQHVAHSRREPAKGRAVAAAAGDEGVDEPAEAIDLSI